MQKPRRVSHMCVYEDARRPRPQGQCSRSHPAAPLCIIAPALVNSLSRAASSVALIRRPKRLPEGWLRVKCYLCAKKAWEQIFKVISATQNSIMRFYDSARMNAKCMGCVFFCIHTTGDGKKFCILSCFNSNCSSTEI